VQVLFPIEVDIHKEHSIFICSRILQFFIKPCREICICIPCDVYV